MREEKVTSLEIQTGVMGVDLGSGLYGFFDDEYKAFAITLDVFLHNKEILYLNKYDAFRFKRALEDMIEGMGWIDDRQYIRRAHQRAD